MKPVYQKGCTHKLNRKKDQKINVRVEIRQRQEKLLTLKPKSRLSFNNSQNLLFLKKLKLYKSKFPKTCLS